MRRLDQIEIWIEAEEWAAGEWIQSDDNSDVIVTRENGDRWIASFFTFKNIVALSEKNKMTGECLNGQYFWASDMILIDELTREGIESVIRQLIGGGSFERVLELIGKRH